MMCSALLPRQGPGFHHSGGISEPLQIENSLVKLCNSQTACEPQVLGDSKDLLNWMRAWQVFILVHFYLGPQHYTKEMETFLCLELPQKRFHHFSHCQEFFLTSIGMSHGLKS